MPGAGKHSSSSDLMSLIHQAGFTGQAAQTMYAIVLAESDGNAQAHNGNAGTGDNSYGLAQINMLGSMGPDRLHQFGLSSNNDLFDPLTNLKVAYALSNHGQDFSPWTTYTRGTYQQYMGQSGAQVHNGGHGSDANFSASGYSASGTGGGGLSSADYKSALNDMAGLLQAVPELRDILNKAVSQGWSLPKFQQAIDGSAWYKAHNDATKRLISLKYQDPAQYKQELGASRDSVRQMANQLGVTLNGDQLDQLAQHAIMNSWTTADLTEQVAGAMNAGTAALKGGFAQNYDQLQQLYSAYGVPISDQALRQRAQDLTAGTTTIDTYKASAESSASSLYPSIAADLKTGRTTRDIADPYIQTMGNTLEINPTAITLNDPLIKKALQGTVTSDGQGGKTTVSTTPIWSFEQTLRADPRWRKTNNAMDTVSSALVKIGQDWGFAT